MMSHMEDMVGLLVTHGGPIGVLLAAAVFMYNKMLAKLSEVQDARVADAKAVTQQLLDVSDKQNETTQELTAALRHNTVAMEGQREWIKELVQSIGRKVPGGS